MKKTDTPLISIITASYNYANFIEKSIHSVLSQTYSNWELIIVDDGSKDNSVEIIKKYTQTYKNVHLYQHKGSENKGLLETIKLGLKKAKGKYIAFLESDDFWTENHLEKKIEALKAYPQAKIIYNDIEPFGDKNRLGIMSSYINRCRLLSKKALKPTDISKYFIISTIIPTFSCLMVEKKLLNKCDFNSPIAPYLDWWLESQMTFLEEALYIEEKLTHWQIHPESYIGRVRKDIDREKEKTCLQSLLEKLKKLNPKKYNSFILNALAYKLKEYDLEMLASQKENLLTTIKDKRIYLYGAGSFAQEVLADFDFSKLNILGIIDADKNKKGQHIGKYEIFNKDEIEKLNPQVIVLMLAEPNLIYYDFLSFLTEKNLSPMVIPNLFEKHKNFEVLSNNKTVEQSLTELII